MQQAVLTKNNELNFGLWATIKRDWNVALLVANVLLVVVSYWLAGLTGMASNIVTKPLRMLIIAVSLYYLFFMTRRRVYYFKGSQSWRVWIFILLNLYVLPFSFSFLTTAEKFANLFPYLVYLNYLTIYLYRNYTAAQLLKLLLRILNVVYSFPLFAYLLTGRGLSEKDIYSETIGGFLNNHYGWTCTVFLATSLDLIRNDRNLSPLHRRFIYVCIPLAFYLLLISGSRSGYVSFAICFLIFVVRNKGTHVVLKALTVLVVSVFVMQLFGDKDSALNKRLDKTQQQRKKGEPRLIAAQRATEVFTNHPVTMLTGFGFYAFREGMQALNSGTDEKTLSVGLHNSYYELLFGSGVLVFAFFLFSFVLPPLFLFFVRHSERFVFLPPFVFIPFFENNMNPGQFLFFPWFLFVFYYVHFNVSKPNIIVEQNDNAKNDFAGFPLRL